MGNFFGRQKETTLEVLERIEKDERKREEYRKRTELKQKHIIGSLVFYALLLYIAGVVTGYLYYDPTDITEWTLFAMPIFAFPSIVWTLKTLFTFWFARRLQTNDASLVELREKRKKMLEEVKEKETFKVAMEILEKYDPVTKQEKAAKEEIKEKRKEEEMILRLSPQRRATTGSPGQNQSQLRRRNGENNLSPLAPSDPKPNSSSAERLAVQGNCGLPQQKSNGTPQRGRAPLPSGLHLGMMTGPIGPPRTPLLPRPILPQERGTMDKFVDYLLGDGPNNRYALVCSQCRSHNGMCLREEFEYMSFRCAYCFFFNPARSQRPHAPKLDQGKRSELITMPTSKNPFLLLTPNNADRLPSAASSSQPSSNVGSTDDIHSEIDPLLEESDGRKSRDSSCSAAIRRPSFNDSERKLASTGK